MPRSLQPTLEALPLLVVTSSLLDLIIRPTISSIDITSTYIVEEALAAFLAVSLEGRFDGVDGNILLEEVDVVVKAIRFDIRRGRQLNGTILNTRYASLAPSSAPTTIRHGSMIIDDAKDEDGYIPSTILTTSISAKFRGHPGDISYDPHHLDKLIFASFQEAKDDSGLHKFLGSSNDPILRAVTDTEIIPTTFANFATGETSFAPPLAEMGAAVVEGNDISTGIIYSGEQVSISPSTSFRSDPMDVIFVVMSGLIFFAMVVLIYLHRSTRGPSHDERVRQFFAPGADRMRGATSTYTNRSDEDPINSAHFSSEGNGMINGKDQHQTLPFHLPSASMPTLSKYHYPIPRLQPRNTSSHVVGAENGLITIPEDEAFASPGYFRPENLRRVDSMQSNISEDVFGIDVGGRESTLKSLDGSSRAEDGDDITNATAQSGGSLRWNQWLQQVMVVNNGMDEDGVDDDEGSSESQSQKTCASTGYSC